MRWESIYGLEIGPQEERRLFFFVASWPAPRVSRWEESCHRLAGTVAPVHRSPLGRAMSPPNWPAEEGGILANGKRESLHFTLNQHNPAKEVKPGTVRGILKGCVYFATTDQRRGG
jgi:hypothetical protein